MRLLQLFTLALLAMAAKGESLNVNARLNCNGAFDMTLQEPTFLYLVDSPLDGPGCPDATAAAGDPLTFSWSHSIIPGPSALNYSILLPGPASPPFPSTIEGLFTVEATLVDPIVFPPFPPFTPSIEFFDHNVIDWRVEGKVCYSDPKVPCVDFSESGTGVGSFYASQAPDGLYHLNFGAASSIPEPSTLLLLATAVGIAWLVRQLRRVA